ncbi:hypothetical protein CVT25_002749 [Psilocybe cyanescens]|uniref:Uncharacterized protein n=1 Tax=Psilocybe cyanescens TaxID=93625 RepID=A0A409XUA1_PSICY|nr:hypothetical protein CVT25_002749 [Psilocybe cyanescens]
MKRDVDIDDLVSREAVVSPDANLPFTLLGAGALAPIPLVSSYYALLSDIFQKLNGALMPYGNSAPSGWGVDSGFGNLPIIKKESGTVWCYNGTISTPAGILNLAEIPPSHVLIKCEKLVDIFPSLLALRPSFSPPLFFSVLPPPSSFSTMHFSTIAVALLSAIASATASSLIARQNNYPGKL